MINPATSQLRITPELLPTTKEVRDAQRKKEDIEAASKAPEVAPQPVPHPTNPDVGGLVDVKA